MLELKEFSIFDVEASLIRYVVPSALLKFVFYDAFLDDYAEMGGDTKQIIFQ